MSGLVDDCVLTVDGRVLTGGWLCLDWWMVVS